MSFLMEQHEALCNVCFLFRGVFLFLSAFAAQEQKDYALVKFNCRRTGATRETQQLGLQRGKTNLILKLHLASGNIRL